MDNVMENKRDTRLDIIRIFALFCVNSVHFFLNSGYMTEINSGARMFAAGVVRSFFVVCVHLFICLSGYLMNTRTVSKKHYIGISKVLVTYLVCSLIYAVFRANYLVQEVTFKSLVFDILAFRGTDYAWYIEMYIGLYLLIPFLNLVFNNLKTQRQALLLLVVLFVMTGLPTTFNSFSFESVEMWKNPHLITRYDKIFPGWWDKLWPLFCYYLGAYLKKYPLKINLLAHFMLLFGMCTADGALNYYKSYGTAFVGGSWNYNSAATELIVALLLFSLLLRIKPKRNGPVFCGTLKLLSDAVLTAYLISCIFDRLYYPILAERVPEVKDRFFYAPLIIIAVFVSSLALALLINFIRNLIKKLSVKLIHARV